MKTVHRSYWRQRLLHSTAISAALAVLACVSPSLAASPRQPGPGKKADDGARDLLLMCQGHYEDPELGLAMCTAYLKGYLDRANYNHVEGGSVEFCSLNGKITPQAAAMAVTRFAFSDPNAIDEPMPVFLSMALQRAFPCDPEMAAQVLEQEKAAALPPPPPEPFVPKGPAGPVGASKQTVQADQPPAPMPEKLVGAVPNDKAVTEPTAAATNYAGPLFGPKGGMGPASAPQPLDGGAMPAAAPGTRKAAMTSGNIDGKPAEIVIHPDDKSGSASGKPMMLSSPFVDAVRKQQQAQAPMAGVARIKPPPSMSSPTPIATDASHAGPVAPNTKPYGPVNADGTPAAKRP